MPLPHKTFELIVEEDDNGLRLDKWLSENISELTRSRLQGLIKEGALLRNGNPFTNGSTKIKSGEHFTLTMREAATASIAPQKMALDIHYEDEHLIVINKAAGLVVHPGAGNHDGTLVNALMAHCGDSLSGIGGVVRPGIVHRIDKDTSGLLVIAKHDKAHLGLASLFERHNIERVYHAIIIGSLRPGVGTLETRIGRYKHDRKKMSVIGEAENRPDARDAVTHYKTLKRFATKRAKLAGDALASLVECKLETGRTHQIRVHMQHLGAPLIGDPVYGRGPGLSGLKPIDDLAIEAIKTLKAFRRQALHAHTLGFIHPITKEALHFKAPPPSDFQSISDALEKL